MTQSSRNMLKINFNDILTSILVNIVWIVSKNIVALQTEVRTTNNKPLGNDAFKI
jgi:hypothetical protein